MIWCDAQLCLLMAESRRATGPPWLPLGRTIATSSWPLARIGLQRKGLSFQFGEVWEVNSESIASQIDASQIELLFNKRTTEKRSRM